MVPPAQAASQLLMHCPIPIPRVLSRIVHAYLARKNDQIDPQTLELEVHRAFSALSEKNFQQPEAGARLVLSLLRGLTWRRHAALQQQWQGRLQAASCQWYQGVRGTGSFCRREPPPQRLQDPETCLQRDCFAPFCTVSLEPIEEVGAPSSVEDAVEHDQIQQKLGLFLEKSPVLGDLFCQLLDADEATTRTIKARWAERFDVTVRTIENWRDRAATLFLASYTGALEQLAQSDPTGHSIVCLRDFSPAYPLPSAPLAWSTLAQTVQQSHQEARQLYRRAWYWMRDWMQQHGYPESQALSLPFQEQHDAT